MKQYQNMLPAELAQEKALVAAHFQALKDRHLSLDMSRGKPGKDQLDNVSGILTALIDPADCLLEGMDVRNYGNLRGLPAAQRLFAELLGCRPEEVLMGGSSSLTMMYDLVMRGFCFGLTHSPLPWSQVEGRKWLCPSPGYDRHFKVTEAFGFEMIPIPMQPTGPDMDRIEELVKDPLVKGIWCVPKYSNPDGIVYSEETILRFARLQAAAPDFTIIWDNAYCIHEFDGDYLPFPDIISLCREAGNPDMVYEFASTSKITLPGAGVAVMAASEANLAYQAKLMDVQLISYDKVNQLRHVKFLKDKAHTLQLMQRHAAILKPKFDCVLRHLEAEIAPAGIGHWQTPKGGYFVSLFTAPGLAKRTVALCKEAGVVLTGAGATYPLGKDPEDSNIRIAPSLPPTEELEEAMEVLCTALKLAALEQLQA
ncbi:MAG: aminotransferase class I/II-fold pyridoxal phosphate-dependent enzyme [Lachnospiraceae bacterium]|nr:aminotransferase class I/II-fold pyridoxal phosphate-dependent enzyme [Lachnospiraceae bacterium]